MSANYKPVRHPLLSSLYAFALCGAMPSGASATMFLYEGFTYSTSSGTWLSSLSSSGGVGWSAAWDAGGRSVTYQQYDFFGANPPQGGIPTPQGGASNKAAVHASAASRRTTDLASKFPAGGTVWFSFQVAFRGVPTAPIHMGFASGTATASGMGITLATNGRLYGRLNATLSSQSLAIPLSEATFNTGGANRSYYILGRLVRGSGGSADTVHIWVNPGLGLPDTPTFSITGATLAAIPDRWSFNNAASSSSGLSNVAIWFDEIKMGTTHGSITGAWGNGFVLLLGSGPAPGL